MYMISVTHNSCTRDMLQSLSVVTLVITSIAEHYNRRMVEAFEGLTGFRRVVDDVVIYDKDRGSHMAHVHHFLQQHQE